jgi:hypothetical protein
MLATPDYAGVIFTDGPNSGNIYAGYLQANPNHGFLSVEDGSTTDQAGMYVDQFGQGIVFGDIKSFRTDHPTVAESEIWYASLEGPEAAAYERGSADLINGHSFVPFSDHFKAIANPDDMTVLLTPLSAESEGLAVTQKSKDGFYVRELDNGTGNYGFDWEVKCQRLGFEDFQVIRKKSEFAGNNRSFIDSRDKRNDYTRGDRSAQYEKKKFEHRKDVELKKPEKDK